ncbi:MAG: hypothetical protein GEV08_19115 [Acidimicrobiia bacterium]|nr:hypothetical protein [Acidimicrobiia bacterium]
MRHHGVGRRGQAGDHGGTVPEAAQEVTAAAAPDDDILDRASTGQRVIVSHDMSTGTLLAAPRQVEPSFIFVRV